MNENHELYKEFLSGDPHGIEVIYLTLREPLLKRGKQWVSGDDAAEDAVSDAFEVLLRRVGLFKTDKHIRDFLYRTLRNKCHNERRWLRRFSELPEDALDRSDLSPAELLELSELTVHTQWIVEKIRTKLRQDQKPRSWDFQARYFEGKTYEEIALERRVHVDTVRQNIDAMRERLEKFLKNS
jgi:RNA polymerase sigma factor (sigma-70 family)